MTIKFANSPPCACRDIWGICSLWICTNWTNSQPSLLFWSTEKAAWKS